MNEDITASRESENETAKIIKYEPAPQKITPHCRNMKTGIGTRLFVNINCKIAAEKRPLNSRKKQNIITSKPSRAHVKQMKLIQDEATNPGTKLKFVSRTTRKTNRTRPEKDDANNR